MLAALLLAGCSALALVEDGCPAGSWHTRRDGRGICLSSVEACRTDCTDAVLACIERAQEGRDRASPYVQRDARECIHDDRDGLSACVARCR